MKRILLGLLLGLLSTGLLCAADIPLENFFKDSAFDEIIINPDGTKVAALSRYKEHLNLYVIDLATKKPVMLTGLTDRDVRGVHWVNNTRLTFTTVKDGYWTGGLFAIDADGRNSRALVKHDDRQAEYLAPYGNSENEILVVSNQRMQLLSDVCRLNVDTGAIKIVKMNPGNVREWLVDHKGEVRLGAGTKDAGKSRFLLSYDNKTKKWKELKTWAFEEGSLELLAFHADNQHAYVLSNLGRNTAAIMLLDANTGALSEPLFEDPVYDAGSVLLSRKTHELLGFSIERERDEIQWVAPRLQDLQKQLDLELPDTHNYISSSSKDQSKVVVNAASDRDPGTFYFFNVEAMTLEKLVSRKPWIKPAQMAEMRPITYTARDGLTIHGYLSIPANTEAKNLPLIVNPHGGPWVRDSWGYNPEVQFLASRGYAVFQMNFRASTGYGRKHLNAGYGQWGRAMQNDITDGVQWLIQQGMVDPDRIAIYGASYGGYASMAGLAFTPELYRCGVNYVGVTDVKLLLQTMPESWKLLANYELEIMTKTDKAILEASSPLHNADKIRVPVFFAYGERDDRVDREHGTKLRAILKHNGVPSRWMSREDEGHGFRRWENKIAFYTELGEFLAENMGVRKR